MNLGDKTYRYELNPGQSEMNTLRSRSFPHLFIEEIDMDMKILPIFFFPSHCSSFSCDLNSMCFLIASVLHVLCSSLASGLNDWRQVWVV